MDDMKPVDVLLLKYVPKPLVTIIIDFNMHITEEEIKQAKAKIGSWYDAQWYRSIPKYYTLVSPTNMNKDTLYGAIACDRRGLMELMVKNNISIFHWSGLGGLKGFDFYADLELAMRGY